MRAPNRDWLRVGTLWESDKAWYVKIGVISGSVDTDKKDVWALLEVGGREKRKQYIKG